MIAIESHLKALLIKALAPFGLKVTLEDIVIEKTKDPKFGDYATNVCLKFAKNLSLKPIDLAKQLINQLTDPHIQRVEVAGPGFLNFFVKTETLTAVIEDILRLNTQFGKSQLGQGKRINLEFVSANPTGPMHVAHARAAALGDVIATLLTNVGYKVTREFYVNDAGGQIRNLALSIFMRYRELIGDKVTLPEDGYFGKDIIEIAKEIRQQYGDKIIYDNTLHISSGSQSIHHNCSNRSQVNEEVLSSVYLLSKCNYFLYSFSNVSLLALIMGINNFKFVDYINK